MNEEDTYPCMRRHAVLRYFADLFGIVFCVYLCEQMRCKAPTHETENATPAVLTLNLMLKGLDGD